MFVAAQMCFIFPSIKVKSASALLYTLFELNNSHFFHFLLVFSIRESTSDVKYLLFRDYKYVTFGLPFWFK